MLEQNRSSRSAVRFLLDDSWAGDTKAELHGS